MSRMPSLHAGHTSSGLLRWVVVLVTCAGLAAQEAPSPDAVRAAIDRVGSPDYATRTTAARTIRRATAASAVPLLVDAAQSHTDGYVRFRALVLLAGFRDPRLRDIMAGVVGDPNDRLRLVAYRYFEHNPDPAVLPELFKALVREQAEFVRPALVRALAAHGTDPMAREALLAEVGRGPEFVRSAVIEALGDYKADYALPSLITIAGQPGPLQDDVALALGKIGDTRALDTLAMLQRSLPEERQPAVAAAACMLAPVCDAYQTYLVDTLRFAAASADRREVLRNAGAGLAALATAGNMKAATALFDVGIPSKDPGRAALALAVGSVALRNPELMLFVLEKRPDREAAIALLHEGLDMLEEDFDEEMFFAAVRRAYWQSAAGSPTRQTAELLFQKLEF